MMKDVAAREGRRAFVGGIGVEADPAAHRGEARGVVVTRVVHVGVAMEATWDQARARGARR